LVLSKDICDVDLIDLLELLLSFCFCVEDIAKFLFVPIFRSGFDVFEFLLEHEHYSASNVQILSPPFVNIIGEFRVREPGIFKPERSVSWCGHKAGFQLYRPVV